MLILIYPPSAYHVTVILDIECELLCVICGRRMSKTIIIQMLLASGSIEQY